MNIVLKSIRDISFVIPKEILEAAFIPKRNAWSLKSVSVEQQLMDLVIRPRVLVDCDILGGTELYVPIGNLAVEQVDGRTLVMRVPKTLTQGRSIISADSILFNDPSRGSMRGISSTLDSGALASAITQLVDGVGKIPVTSTSNIDLIAENTIMVYDFIVFPSRSVLKCRIGNDENLSNIPVRAAPAFSLLIEYAVKSYIYNKLNVELDMGELFSGSQLGKVREVVDGYSDTEELYKTQRKEVIQKISYMADKRIMTNHIRLLVGGRH